MSKTVGPLVLLVDDEESNLALRKMVVEREGYRTLTATRPTNALEVFERVAVDLAVVDYYMPEMNGDELCKEMKRIKAGIPLILLSGVHIDELSDCPDYVVVKGGDPRELLKKIAEVLTVKKIAQNAVGRKSP